MLSGQMIYTACGKDKSGAFSVWSKSESITKDECNEIIKFMTYNRPRNAPYDPTPEDIAKYFPAKYGYFALSTGKLCVAKSSYIGDVYSELDSRSGNFLIHAYVFDKLDGSSNPFFLFNLNFKTKLEYSEWHDNPAPETLPQVELNINQTVSESEIKQIISVDKEFFISLAQAFLNVCKEDKVIVFSDNDETVRAYNMAISFLIPNLLYKKLTFSNQYYPQSEYTLLGLGMPPIKIRNISDDFLLTAFNYQQAVNEGKYVFNKAKSICSTLTPERYLSDIIFSIEQNGLYATIKKVDLVNKIMEDLNCDENTALRVLNLKVANFDWFESFDEFTDTFIFVRERKYIDDKSFALVIWKEILQTQKWGSGTKVAFLTKYVYENATPNIKQSIMQDYIRNFENYDIQRTLEEKAFVSQLQSKAPFAWGDFIEYSVNSNEWELICTEYALFSVSYMYFTIAASKSKSNPIAEGILIKLLNQSLVNHNLSELEKYIEVINSNGQDYKKKLWDIVAVPLSKQLFQSDEGIEFFFSLLYLTSDIEQRKTMFENMIATNCNSQNFLPTYVKCLESNKAMLAAVESELKDNGTYEAFFMAKEAYGFKNATQISCRMLLDYFEKFYKQGHDQGVYLTKLRLYLSTQQGKSKLSETLKLYEAMKDIQDGFRDFLQIIQAIEKEAYSLSINELILCSSSQIKLLGEIDSRLKSNSLKTSGNYEIVLFMMDVTGKNGKEKKFDGINQKNLLSGMSNYQLSYICEYSMKTILDLYLDAKRALKLDIKGLISVAILPLINVKDFERELINAIKSSDKYDEIIADIMSYAFNNTTNGAITLKAIIERYIESLQRADYKNLFKKIGKYINQPELEAVQKYIDEFLENHKGFLESLFSKKKTK